MPKTWRKQAEIVSPASIGEEGRAWLRSKPFGNTPRESNFFRSASKNFSGDTRCSITSSIRM